ETPILLGVNWERGGAGQAAVAKEQGRRECRRLQRIQLLLLPSLLPWLQPGTWEPPT
ncbi:unnamed protein product, partial [Polarella glacialis]